MPYRHWRLATDTAVAIWVAKDILSAIHGEAELAVAVAVTAAANSDSASHRRVDSGMSHEAINKQPVPGNLQEEKPFTFQCSGIVLIDYKTLFENQLMFLENVNVCQ